MHYELSDRTKDYSCIAKVDLDTKQVVKYSKKLQMDHANDMTYDPVKKQIVVVNMLDNLVSIIDPETLTLTEQKALPYGTWGVGYIDGAGQYAFLAYGSPSGLVIADGNFNPVRSSALADTTGYVGQGMDANAEYAYVPLSPQSGTKDNIIQIFEIKSGKFIGKITVNTTMESESMFHVGEDFYMQFNNSGSKIAKLEFYEKFE
jgi:DNA-binding beta-propeller fold protein YncE